MSGRGCQRRLGLMVVGLWCALGSTPAWAQGAAATKASAEPKWTVEVHWGAARSPTPTGGTAGRFPAGTTFTTEPGFPSRANSSWFFGDGAALFNQVNAQFASRFNLRLPQLVPLDAVLTSAGLSRESGRSVGFRLERRMTPRLGVEVSLDLSQGRVRIADAAGTAIEATRTSFETAFTGLLATIPQTGLRVTSTAEMGEAATQHRVIVGALKVALTRRGRLATHLLAGGGRTFNDVRPIEARLRGSYQFRFLDTFAVHETDTVTIRFSERDQATVAVFGGGITSNLGRQHGVRADVRVLVGGSGISTSVDASPTVERVGPFVALPSTTNPSLQFSTTVADRSSLDGSTAGLKTFTGSGLDTRIVLNVGYFVRF